MSAHLSWRLERSKPYFLKARRWSIVGFISWTLASLFFISRLWYHWPLIFSVPMVFIGIFSIIVAQLNLNKAKRIARGDGL